LRHLKKGWEFPGTVRNYEIFVRSCPLYTEMASALASHCVREDDRVIVDLGAGTGINTLSILNRMNPQAQLWSVDPSEAMLSRARSRVQDPRVSWLVGDSGVLHDLKGKGWVDSFLANASVWMDVDANLLFSRVAEMLNSGGIMGCTIPAEYLGEIHHLLSPEARAFSEVLDGIRRAAKSKQERSATHEVQEELCGGNFPTSSLELKELLEELGFGGFSFYREETIVTAEDRARWYALPPILAAWIPDATEAVRAAAVRELFARTRVLPPIRMVWLAFWAWKK